MHNNTFFDDYIRMIEQNLDWGPSSHWTAYHFSRLSEEILEKTGKTVSDSTLKRFFGKKDTKENYSPQLYTRNAIAQYLGYKDWQGLVAFMKSHVQHKRPVLTKRKTIEVIIYLSTVAVIIYITMILLPTKKENTGYSDSMETAPSTAVFQYNVEQFTDSVFIDFGNQTRVHLLNNGYYTEYRLIKDFNMSLDSAEVSAVVKNRATELGKLCYDIEIWLLGTRNTCRVRFVEPGRFRFGHLQISEKSYSSCFDNLSVLAREMNEWRKICFKIKGHRANIYYEGKAVCNESYKTPMGNLIGIYFRFYGTGSVKNVQVLNHKGEVAYLNEFRKRLK